MSEFAVEVLPITIHEHPNADAIQIAKVGDYDSIVAKGQFKSGDLVAYIPEGSIVPHGILEFMGLDGKLSGNAKNRVKAIKLRGVLSQGLCYPVYSDPDSDSHFLMVANDEGLFEASVEEGENVAELLGIIKYEPKPPTSMAGQCAKGRWYDVSFKYDFENIKKRPYLFDEGEEVVITEKIHGTFMVIGVIPDALRFEMGARQRFFISSKGLFGNGFVLDLDTVENNTNLYVRAAINNDLFNKMTVFEGINETVYIMGEVFGSGVQDLTYGNENGDIHFRAFDMAFRTPNGVLQYADHATFKSVMDKMHINTVPELYVGGFDKAKMLELTGGKEGVSGKQAHMREGVVVKSVYENNPHPRYGRKIAKSVSPDYLLRKNATEFN